MSTPKPPPPGTPLLGDDAIIELVGHEAFARAMVAVRSGHVHGVEVDPGHLAVSGRVKGTYRDDYAVSVFLARSPSGVVTAHRTSCTCPVVTDCKHAAAVLIVARHQVAVEQPARPVWEKTLDRLLSAPVPPPPTERDALALEFGVERVPPFRDYAGRQDLRIRPARQGRSRNWVRSGISWDDLDHVARSYIPEHRELLLQFRSAAGASARYALPRNPWLSLSTVSSGFWGLLDQADAVGLTLITAAPVVGPIRTAERATVGLDLRRGAGGDVELRPRVTIAGLELPLAELGVIGEPAHGIFHLAPEPSPTAELFLARLDGSVGRDLRQLVVNAGAVGVPAADEPRLRTEFLPRLGQAVTLSSSDGSISLPDQLQPTLGLTVRFQPDRSVDLEWSVSYGSGPSATQHRINEPPNGRDVRDRPAEARLLAALPLPEGPPVSSTVTLRGPKAWAFVEHTLPKLTGHGVEVSLTGQVVDYRESLVDPAVAVSAARRPGMDDWFDLDVTVSLDGEEVPFEPVFVALTEGADHVILDSGVYFSLDRPEFGGLRELIEESRQLRDHREPGLAVHQSDVSVWDQLVDLGVGIDQALTWTRAVQALSGRTAVGARAVPDTVRAQLRPYQHEGFTWLARLWTLGLGGILADDMGLGKTLQALALVAYAKQERPGAPFLVVTPTSVVSNWAAEAERFTPGLKVRTLTASLAKRGRSLATEIGDADLVVTSYALLRIDSDALAALPWSGLILDEAQFVKNHRAKTYQAARRLTAPFTLAITGTPLENSLMDLWALLSLTAPGLFPHADRFGEYYRRPIERDHDVARLAQLRRRIRPLMLRRTKQAVAADLPPKQEQVIQVDLHPRHQRVYQTHLQRERQKVLGLLDDVERNRFTILRSLTLLRRLALDPGLLDTDPGDAGSTGVPAAKVDLLLAELGELVSEGHRALVFSQFTTFLSRVRTRLDEAGIETAYLDGRTRNRDRAVERFRSGAAPVFLISLKAGGVGLNLTEADYCFVLDPWWNPAVETQAVDRAHRIGQTRPVMVYRLVATATIEEKVMALKARKAALFDAVVGGEALAGAALTADEIRDLLAG